MANGSEMFSLEDEVMGRGSSEPLEGTIVPDALGALPAGTGMLQIRGSYSTAVRVEKKRDLNEISRRLKEEANFMGEGAYYGWGAGKDRIEGPSQELALAAARVWGNCALEVAPIQETPDSWIITTYFIDLETGFTMSRPFRMSKRWTVAGKLDAERKTDVRFQIGATKSARNVVLKALPGWLIDQAMEQAKAGVRGKLEKYVEAKGLPAAQDLALSVLLKVGVKEDDVLRKFGVSARSALNVEKLVIIQGDIKAIQGGEARAEEIYPPLEGAAGANGAQPASGGSSLGSFAARATPRAEQAQPRQEEPDQPGVDESEGRAMLAPEKVTLLLELIAAKPAVSQDQVAKGIGQPGKLLDELEGNPGETAAALYTRVLQEVQRLKGK